MTSSVVLKNKKQASWPCGVKIFSLHTSTQVDERRIEERMIDNLNFPEALLFNYFPALDYTIFITQHIIVNVV